jgi:squalene synthase HpnC
MPVDHYENFPVASILLPQKMRRPVEVIYAFARSADDIADEGDASPEERLAALDAYQRELDLIERGEATLTPLFARVAATIAEHRLPIQLFRDLLSAFAQDVTVKRYANFDALLDYCRRSANPVGRLLLHLTGNTSEEELAQSDNICTALQLINFWQDVGIDWQKERVYLPQEDLRRFRVREEQIAQDKRDANWSALLDFQIDRARSMMLAGAPLTRSLRGRFGWEIRLTVQGGLRILEKIRRVRGDVFAHRPQLTPADWALMALRSLRAAPLARPLPTVSQ